MEKTFSRPDGRSIDTLRRHRITPGVMKHAEGSVLVEFGDTRVLVSASVENRVPRFLYGSGGGWLSAEYDMLPRATNTRNQRAASRGKQSGRSLEIGRLIGRSLRSALNLKALGERTIWIDCDVIQADGGTRTAAITGGFVALAMALADLKKRKQLSKPALKCSIAAISVGIYRDTPILDLCYLEDKDAEADVNIVMTGDGRYVEVQGTAEGEPFASDVLNEMLELAKGGIATLTEAQKLAMSSFDRDDIWLPGARP